jgi:hypothetical protein
VTFIAKSLEIEKLKCLIASGIDKIHNCPKCLKEKHFQKIRWPPNLQQMVFRSGCAIVLFLATRYFPCRIRYLSVSIYRQNSLNIHFKQIICMFSSKKKNVELNLMFISQVNNIGNRLKYGKTVASSLTTLTNPRSIFSHLITL